MAQLSSDLNSLAANVSQYVVRPLNAFGLGGFVFDIEGETTVNLSAEITDHFVEDTTTIQDHIAVKPKKVTLKSYVGELVYRQDEATDTFVQKAVRKLTTVNQYLPDVTAMAQQVLDLRERDFELDPFKAAQDLSSRTINRVTDYWAFVKNLTGGLDSRQQQAYMYFKALMEQKILVSVQTPFEFMSKMAIETITAVQPEGTKFISDFSITLKQIRTAELLAAPQKKYTTRPVNSETSSFQGRAFEQNTSLTNLGGVTGIDAFIPPVDINNTAPLSLNDLPNFNPNDPTFYDLNAAAIDAFPPINASDVGE